MVATQVDQPGDPKTSNAESSSRLREIATTVIAFIVIAVTLWMLIDSYRVAGNSLGGLDEAAATAALEALSRQQVILTIAVGFLGTILGYYFGKAPAEARAVTAEKSADSAEKSEAMIRLGVRSELPTYERALGNNSTTRGGIQSLQQDSPEQLQAIRDATQRLRGLVG